MRRMTAIMAGLVLATGVAARADGTTNTPAAVKAATVQTVCPVMKGAIDKQLFVDHDGKRIYVCCRGCIAPIRKDPAKYVKEMEAAGITLEKVPEAAKAP